MSEAFFIEREPDERLLIAMLILDTGADRAAVLKYLRPHHFTLRYADWLNAITALHSARAAIDVEALIKRLATAGVHQPEEELRLIYAEIDGNRESVEHVAQRVIQYYRLRYFVNLMTAALNQGRKGQVSAFDQSVRSARRLAHEMSIGAPICPPDGRGASIQKAPANVVGVDRRRSRFTTAARQPS